jgi:hypothetical protein
VLHGRSAVRRTEWARCRYGRPALQLHDTT